MSTVELESRHSDRSTRIDYKILNNTGEKVILQSDTELETQSNSHTANKSSLIKESALTDITLQLKGLKVNSETMDGSGQDSVENKEHFDNSTQIMHTLDSKYSVIKDEIDDFIDENPINMTTVFVSDIDTCIDKISQLRTDFRIICKEIHTHIQLYNTEDNYSKESEVVLHNIKEYIIHAKERKLEIRQSDKDLAMTEKSIKLKKDAEESVQKQQAAKFLINEVSRITKDLHNEFSKERNEEIQDEEISRRKEDLPSNLIKLDQLSTKFQRCLEIIPDEYEDKDTIISQITEEYENLVMEKEKYERFIEIEMKEREMSKEKTFQVSSLNIKIDKFKGYDSELDIYSFQYEFEKLHLKSTPKKMLPDLLKYNYLSEPALSLVKSLDNVDEMWIRLKRAYGDPKTLLNRKLTQVRKIGPLWKLNGERLKESIMSLINGISDLISLSKYHGIENKLYHGDHLNVIYGLMGESRVKKWITITCDQELEEEELWNKLISFLDKELKVQQELSLIKPKLNQEQRSQDSYCSNSIDSYETELSINEQECHVSTISDKSIKCSFCGEFGHYETKLNDGSTMIQYYACKKFTEMNPLERFKELRKHGFCYQCLFPGAAQNTGKHANRTCQNDFTCKHPSHDRYDMRKHVLVCYEHRNTDENKKILDTYKRRFILQRPGIPEFSKEIKLSFMSQQSHISVSKDSETLATDDKIINENGIYMLQTVQIGDQQFTLFFDTGCSDMVSKHDAISRIGRRAKLEIEGTTTLRGVGNIKMESKHGIYQVRLPLVNGKDAVLAGVCLDKITNQFPSYPVKGQIENDIKAAYTQSGGVLKDLPRLPDCIGGNVDFMIGAKYTRYHPQAIFSLPSGLTIYKSPFLSTDGIQGVIGGPHVVITAIDKAHSNDKMCQHAYLSDQFKLYQTGYQVDPDVHLLGMKYSKDFKHDSITKTRTECKTRNEKLTSVSLLSIHEQKCFEDVENAASEILYRCIDCRKCQKCKNGERIESISIKEEIEQDIINQSVTVDHIHGITEAKLPLIENPVYKLAPNKCKALAVYNSQLKRLSKHPENKQDVIRSEAKLQELGHVEYVCNLTDEQQRKLKESPVQNFIPWSVVWKDNSLSTPCRIVFNASLPTETGLSLNDILAKGRNNMNLLVEIFIRWRSHAFAFHSDIQKMYNTVKLREDDWNLQRYI